MPISVGASVEITAVGSLPPAGKEPVSRKFQSVTAIGSQMVMFGGQSLEDNADLNDLFFLSKVSACVPYCVALPASQMPAPMDSCKDSPLPVHDTAALHVFN